MAAQTTGVAAAGDEVGRLYAEYGSKLLRFCQGRLRSAEEAEDAVQTTFLRVYTALRQGTVPEYEAAWLYKIAHNVCLSRIESSARRARLESPQDFSLLEEELAAPAGRSDELVGLADALAAMPPNLRQAILLREWQGLSYAEIAEALDISVSAVESLIFRARRHLAKALVEPAQRIAGALNLPWIAAGIRSLFAGAGAGTKLAAGVALLAIGGGGVGVGLTVGAAGHPRPAVTVQPAAATGAAAGAGAGVQAGVPAGEMAGVTGGSRNGKRAQPPGAKGKAAVAARAQRNGTRRRVPLTPGAPGAPGTPTAPGVPAPTGSGPPATTPQRPGTTGPVQTTPHVGLPVTTPAVSTPPVTIALPTVPGVPPVPPVTVPSVTVPPVTVPPVTVPPVTVPPVTTPTLPVPVPTVTTPAITTPTVTLPRP